MAKRFPRWLAVANVVYAVLGAIAALGIYNDLTSKLIHDGSEQVGTSLGESEHPVIAVSVLGIGLAITTLLVASAVGGWRQRSWARITTLAWIPLVVAAQVFVIVQRDLGYGLGYDIVAHAFPVVTVYALVTLAALYAPSVTAATPASPRA